MPNQLPSFEHLEIKVDQGIATVRPTPVQPVTKENLDHTFFSDMKDVLVSVARDPSVGALLLVASNASHFVPPIGSGHLLSQTSLQQRAARLHSVQQLSSELLTFRKPLVAAVTGKVRNIGAHLALLADAIVASDSAVFSDSHVPRGLAAGDGGTMLWPPLVGLGMARQILLEGRELTAAEALSMGLVARVVPEDDLYATSLELAQRLRDMPSVAFMATKLAINNWFRMAALFSWDLASAYEAAAVGEPTFAAVYSVAPVKRSRSGGRRPSRKT